MLRASLVTIIMDRIVKFHPKIKRPFWSQARWSDPLLLLWLSGDYCQYAALIFFVLFELNFIMLPFLSIYVPNMLWIHVYDRSISSFLNLGGRVVMRRAAAARRRLLICQNLGEQLPTLPTGHLGPCYAWYNVLWAAFRELKVRDLIVFELW